MSDDYEGLMTPTDPILSHAVVIARPGPDRDEALRALHLARGAATAEIAWDHAPEEIGRQAVVGVIMVEAHDAAEADLVATLPRVDTLARTLDRPVVVSLRPEQIDLVTGVLFGPHVQLLCQPSMADRVAALACLAGRPDGVSLHDATRESEVVRLQRLNEEVARIAETLARLTRRDRETSATAAVAERTMRFGAPPMETEIDVSAQEVRDAIRSRRMRDQVFGPGLFEDPAWDMLLDLFAAQLEHIQVSVSSLCIAAAVAPTTALRWIAKLTDVDLLERRPDPFDRRRAFMQLSPTALDGMRRYCTMVKRADLAIA